MEHKPMWMKTLAEEYPEFANKPLAEIAIPGSHDSGTHNISSSSPLAPDCAPWARNLAGVLGNSTVQQYHAPWSKCQSYDVLTQLLNGIRYLDLRVCNADGELWLCHAQLSVLVSDVLGQIRQFISEIGVDEVLLLDFNHFYHMDRDTHAVLCTMIMSALSEWICPVTEHTCRVTLSELWKTPQRILVFYNNPVEVADHPWLWLRTRHISSPWHNTTDTNVLLQRMTEQWEKWRSVDDVSYFTVTQSQRSPDATLITSTVMSTKSKTSPLAVKSTYDLAHETHPLVCDWLKKRQEAMAADGCKWAGVNIAIADFVELFDTMWIEGVINLNVPISST